MTYLTPLQAETNLRLGKELEQWLGRTTTDAGPVLRWVAACRAGEAAYTVVLYEALEAERAGYDLYGLYAVERDEDGALQQVFGAGKEYACSSPEQVFLRVAELGGSTDRFVNGGLLQDEYVARGANDVPPRAERMNEPLYFVLNLDERDRRPDPRARYEVQRLDGDGRAIERCYLDGRGERLGPCSFLFPRAVAEAALRQECGRGDYVDEGGSSAKPF